MEYARRGYVVIATDMHGQGDSESTYPDDLYSAAVGLDATVELAGSLPYVDSSRIAVTGHSSGGAACDMAVAVAILASNFDLSVPLDSCFCAEIGLSGELRPVSQVQRRIAEAKKIGFKKIYISSFNKEGSFSENGIEVVPVADIPALCRLVFK